MLWLREHHSWFGHAHTLSFPLHHLLVYTSTNGHFRHNNMSYSLSKSISLSRTTNNRRGSWYIIVVENNSKLHHGSSYTVWSIHLGIWLSFRFSARSLSVCVCSFTWIYVSKIVRRWWDFLYVELTSWSRAYQPRVSRGGQTLVLLHGRRGVCLWPYWSWWMDLWFSGSISVCYATCMQG